MKTTVLNAIYQILNDIATSRESLVLVRSEEIGGDPGVGLVLIDRDAETSVQVIVNELQQPGPV